MKHKYSLLILPLLLSLLLCACGNNNSKNIEASKSVVSESTKEIVTSIPDVIPSEGPIPTSEPEPEPETYRVEIIAVGDNLIHSMVIKSGLQNDGTYNYDSMYENIKDEIAYADIKIINQETMLVSNPNSYSGYPTFGSPYEIGDAVINAGFNVITHATNHSFDKGVTGVYDSIAYWREHPEVLMTGIYESEEAYNTISVMEVNNIKIAFLNYTYSLNGFNLPSDAQYLINTLYSEEKIKNDLEKANELADFVIVLPHWGTEYVYEPTDYQISWARAFVDHGADLIIGSHPHVVEPLEILLSQDGREVPCYFSLGNFISNQDEVPRMLGGMAKITIEMTEGEEPVIVSATMEPIVTHISSDVKEFRTYMLKDYTDELAASHYLTRKGKTVSVEKLQTLYDSIVN